MTRTLLLLRHGKAVAAQPDLPDHERALVPRGERDAARMGKLLRHEAPAPDLVLCSTAVRTRQTLDRLGLDGAITVKFERPLYLAEAGRLLARLRRLGRQVGTVLVVGHNLGLEELAHALAGAAQGIGHVPTAGLAWFEVEAPGWKALGPGTARLVRFATPKDGAE